MKWINIRKIWVPKDWKDLYVFIYLDAISLSPLHPTWLFTCFSSEE